MAKDIKIGYGTKWDAIAANDLADDGSSSSAARVNTTELYLGAWIIVKCDDGAGADADGSTLFFQASVDGGTTYSDTDAHPILTIPSPDSGTIVRHCLLLNLPAHWKLTITNETGNTADYDVDVLEFYQTVG